MEHGKEDLHKSENKQEHIILLRWLNGDVGLESLRDWLQTLYPDS